MKKILLPLFLLCPLFLSANDTSGTVLPTGNIQFNKQDGIKMSVEALRIRQGEVEVNYLFENTTDKDITTQVFFPLPKQDFIRPYMDDYFHDHAFNFKLWVNGEEQKYEYKISIYQQYNDGDTVYDNRDITEHVWPVLKDKIKTPDSIITEGRLDDILSALPETQIKALAEQKFITYDFFYEDSDDEQSKGKKWQSAGKWNKAVTFYWEQTFPAGKTVWVKHTYTPASFGNSVGAPNNDCMEYQSKNFEEYDKFITAQRKKYGMDGNEGYFYFGVDDYMEYILTTANNWQGGIGSFNLMVESAAGAVGCLNNEPFMIDKAFFARNLKNFSPQGNIGVEYIYGQNATGEIIPGAVDVPRKLPDGSYQLYRVGGPANVRAKPVNGKVTGKLADKTYAWAKETTGTEGWYFVVQNNVSGYTFKDNLITVFEQK